MRAWLTMMVPELLRRTPADIAATLAAAQMSRQLSGEPAQLRAWEAEVVLLQRALAAPNWRDATIALEYDMLRLEKRIDAVLVTDRAIFVLEFKVGTGPITPASLSQAEDYAQDLWDFHAGSRQHPIIPVLIQTEADHITPWQSRRLIVGPGVAPVVQADAAHFSVILEHLQSALTAPPNPLVAAEWIEAEDRPS